VNWSYLPTWNKPRLHFKEFRDWQESLINLTSVSLWNTSSRTCLRTGKKVNLRRDVGLPRPACSEHFVTYIVHWTLLFSMTIAVWRSKRFRAYILKADSISLSLLLCTLLKITLEFRSQVCVRCFPNLKTTFLSLFRNGNSFWSVNDVPLS
jgi:hypothetical protein